MKKVTVLIGFLALLVSACGGGSTGCDTPLTVAYVTNELTTEPLFTNHNISVADTTLIHEDGNQGNTYDIDRILLSRIKADDGDTLAISYSAYATQDAPPGSYMAFYIDTDNNIDTGFGPGVIGADALILDEVGETNGAGILNSYFSWQASGWLAHDTLGFTSSTASYFAGCSLGLAIYIPWYEGLATLNLADANGMMMLTTFSENDPNKPNSPIDTTGLFSFSFP